MLYLLTNPSNINEDESESGGIGSVYPFKDTYNVQLAIYSGLPTKQMYHTVTLKVAYLLTYRLTESQE